MKTRTILAVLITLAMILSACAQATPVPTQAPAQATNTSAPQVQPTQPPATQPPAAATQPPAPVQTVELRMMWYDDGKEGEVMRDLLNRFEADNPDIKVVMDTVAYADLHTILQTAVEGGQAPDIARITDVPRFRAYYLDMRPYMTDAAAWTSNWPELTLDWMRQAGSNSDGLHGFPTQFTVTGPFINTTLFEQAGVALPTDSNPNATWADWTAAAKEVAEKTETPYAVSIDRTGHRFWGPSLSNGATYVDPATGKFTTIDTPGFRETAQMVIEWHTDNITPREVWVGSGGSYAAAKDFFVNGQLVLYMSGSWQVGSFTDLIGDNFDWQVIPNPCGTAGCTGIPGGAALMAFQNTKHPEEVTRVMEYLSSEDVIREFSARSLFIPGHLGVIAKGIEFPSSNEALNAFMAEIPKLMDEAYLLQYHTKSFMINTEIRDRLSQVIAGEMNLDEAILKIQEKAEEANAAP
jgi:alpha-1,4-digalacturonate transport system substrate-binding protein